MVPVACGLLDKNFVQDLKNDGTYSEAVFDREYESKWGGGSDLAFFSPVEFDRARVIDKPITEAPLKPIKGSKIIMGYDVGRSSDNSSLVIIQLIPSYSGTSISYIKKVVNIYNFEKMHFQEQARMIKRLYFKYRADKIVIDANGLGIGLVDFLTVSTPNEKLEEDFPPFGVDRESDPKKTYEKFYKISGGIDEILYLIKAGSTGDNANSPMHDLCSAQISSGKVQFLIDEQLAEEKFKRTAIWKTYNTEKKIELMMPYKMTKILREEMLNLKKKDEEGGKTNLKRISTGIRKDKFSAFEYALWYARKLELKNRGAGAINGNMGLATGNASRQLDRTNSSIRDRISGKGSWTRD